MTLREAVLAVAKSEIPHPEVLAHLTICNIDDLCPIGVADYLLSFKFREDMDKVQDVLQEYTEHGFYDLELFIDGESGEYELKVKPIFTDCIETEQ